MAKEDSEKTGRQNYKIITLNRKEMTDLLCNLITNLTNTNYQQTSFAAPVVDVWDKGKYLYTRSSNER
jgi:hypothetical protein